MDSIEALKACVADTLENIAFQEISSLASNPLPQAVLRSFRQGRINIYSPWQGTFVITLSPSLLKILTANIYGLDPETSESSMEEDTLAELLNTIAGAWMRAITDHNHPYELGLPDIERMGYLDCTGADMRCFFRADDDFFEVGFFNSTE